MTPETVIIELTAAELATIRDALAVRLHSLPGYANSHRAQVIEAQTSLDRQAKP
jgi:hypothetical protein